MDGLLDLFDSRDIINQLLARYGVKFGIYKHGEFKEQLFPFDPIPRIIDKKEFKEGIKYMVLTVCSVALPVDETLRIQKNRLVPAGSEKPGMKRISIVTGTHGDELERQYVCWNLIRKINEHPELLRGIVDVYPALNPLGIDSITRGIPGFDLDMNRIFPGNADGSMAEFVASKIMDDIKGSDMCIDIHASNIFLREIPQVRISEITKERLIPYAKLLGVDFIWVHAASTVLESTLAHSLNSVGTPTLVVEMGVGMRITKEYGDTLVEGIFNLMHEMGIWAGETIHREPQFISEDDEVEFINATAAGIFTSTVHVGSSVVKSDVLAEIIDPYSGEVCEEVISPVNGTVFFMHNAAMTYSNVALFKIIPLKEF